jgi:putative addiction module component (TIGR02574 family)
VSEAARQLPPGFEELSVEEQIAYVQFLWERIAPRVDQHPVPEAHNAVLDERLKELADNPDASQPADEVVARLRAGLPKS